MLPFGGGPKLTDEQLLTAGQLRALEARLAPANPKARRPVTRQGVRVSRSRRRDRATPSSTTRTRRSATQLASVHRDGRRKWIYARQPSGRYYRARTLVSLALLAFLVAAPFVRIRGQPLVLLNVLERRFVLFGIVFWPQDFYLVVLVALAGHRHARAVHRGGRPGLVRLAVPADGVHGDGVPPHRVPDRRLGRAAAAARRGAVDGGRLGPRRVQARAVLRPRRSPSPTCSSPTSSAPARSGPSSPTRRAQHLAGLVAITVFSLALLRRLRPLPRAGLHARLSRTAG